MTSKNTTTSDFPPLAEELNLVRANFAQRDWIQGNFENAGAVCAHGAVRTCQGLRPGDEQIISAVMQAQGLTFDFNDKRGRTKAEVAAKFATVEVTDAALEATFGPQWRKIVWLVRRAATLTVDEANRMAAARDAARAAARDAARAAARDAARAAARDAARDAARAAVLACVVEDLVGHHGLTQEHIDALTAPWMSVIGEIGEAR